MAQEAPLRAFTRRMWDLRGMNYWQHLEAASLLSSERKKEHYRVIYAWKVIQGLVPNYGLVLDTSPASRRRQTMAIPPLSGSMWQTGPSMKTPSRQRDLDSLTPSLSPWETGKEALESFKGNLGSFMAGIPDQPAVPDLVPGAQNYSGVPITHSKTGPDGWGPVKGCAVSLISRH